MFSSCWEGYPSQQDETENRNLCCNVKKLFSAHPLVQRYQIEALKDADHTQRVHFKFILLSATTKQLNRLAVSSIPICEF